MITMNNNNREIIDISTAEECYQGDQIHFLAYIDGSIVDAYFSNTKQLYEFAPAMGFTSGQIVDWFLEQGAKNKKDAVILDWCIQQALMLVI